MSHEAVHRRSPLEPAPITIPEWAAWIGSHVEDLQESEYPPELVDELAAKYLGKVLRGLHLLGVAGLPDDASIAARGVWKTLVGLREELAVRAANLSRRLGPWELVTSDGVLIEMVFDSTPGRSADAPAGLAEELAAPAGAEQAVSPRASRAAHQVAKELSPGRQAIVNVIRESGRRMTTKEILGALAKRETVASEGTTKVYLSLLREAAILTNGKDSRGKGYGLAEWDR